MMSIGRVSDRSRKIPLEGLADRSTSLGIPNSNGAVIGSRDDVLAIGRVSNRESHIISVPLDQLANRSTSLGVPDPNSAVVGSGDDILAFGRESNRIHTRNYAPLEARQLQHQTQCPRFDLFCPWIQ
jgi:hypothetical protein